jgi:hypothetical protein
MGLRHLPGGAGPALLLENCNGPLACRCRNASGSESMRAVRIVCATVIAASTLGNVACEDDTVPPTPAPPNPKPSLLVRLLDTCNTPDGMRLFPSDDAKNADIVLSCPNFGDPTYPGILMQISKDQQGGSVAAPFFAMPPHPATGKAGPTGLDFGPDGNLYVADNQYRYDQTFKSRLIRVRVDNGTAVGVDVLVEGFKAANAVAWKGDHLYVSETWFDLPDEPGASGIYRFALEELNTPGGVKLLPPPTDPHLLARFSTEPNRGLSLAGADGVAFDKDGNLFAGNFGDGVVSRITFDDQDNIATQERWVLSPQLKTADGMFADKGRNRIYIADSKDNAIRVLSSVDGTVTSLWENGNSDGAEGLLDQPTDVLVRGDQLIIANFDLPPPAGGIKNDAHDSEHTLSVIRLR